MLFVKNDAMHLYNSKTVGRKEGKKIKRREGRREGGERHIIQILHMIYKKTKQFPYK